MVKKIKIRKHKKRVSSHSQQDITQRLSEIYESNSKNQNISIDTARKAIPDILRKYSVHDIASSIFVSSLWLPNIASGIKYQLLAAIFASMKQEEFASKNAIKDYADFNKLMQAVHPLLPIFMMLEDYVPELDWGQIKFYHDKINYKIFYGNELENVYDYLMLFQMMYVPFDQAYIEQAGRSPADDLRLCLKLQNDIVTGISNQAKSEDLTNITPGHIEIPRQQFWSSGIGFFDNYNVKKNYPADFLRNYSIQLGSWPSKYLDSSVFGDMASVGQILPAFFISYDDQHFPILPRRYTSILFDSWSPIYEKHHVNIGRKDMPLSMSIGGGVHKYIKARIKSSFLYPLVSATTEEGRPHDIWFNSAFLSKDRLVLIYVTNPASSNEDIGKELEGIATKLHEAMTLINKAPTILALNLDRQNVQFKNEQDDDTLKPLLFVVVPHVSTTNFHVTYPKALPGTIILMDHFLAIIDELENADVFADFIEYVEEYEKVLRTPLISLLDVFGSFKSSLGVLVPGASKPDFISLDPHWGSNLRYETLSKFWAVYPDRNFFDHPRSWTVTQETASRVRFESRGYFGAALYCHINSTSVFINAPFQDLSYEQGSIANLLMECLEDMMSRNKSLVGNHQFFKVSDQLHVLLFPLSLVLENEKFKHLRHINPEGKYWRSDYGFPGPGELGIRLVFDDKLLSSAFAVASDRTLEVDLVIEVLGQLDKYIPDNDIQLIRNELEKLKPGKPRFTIQFIEKPAAFPEFISPEDPALAHFKRAKKRIAELARQCNLSPGYYTLDDAKSKLNALRTALVKEVDAEISRYAFAESIPFLIERIDALTDRYERTTQTIKRSIAHEVDYSREERYAKHHGEYINLHKNYRYLIEKFIQLTPQGKQAIEKDQFQYLIAFIDWLHVFYSASDSLHYGIHTAGMNITNDYTAEIKYDGNLDEMERKFAAEEASIKLGLIGNPNDRVESPRSINDLLSAIDLAFEQDLGFGFKSMVNVLQILTHWPNVKSGISTDPCYSATGDDIIEAVLQSVSEIHRDEIPKILEFLTLKSSDVTRLMGQDKPCADVPVWEHKKRFARYNLRPLIKINNRYCWGPYSTMKSGIIWSGSLSFGTLPTDLQSHATQEVINSEKKLIEDALEDKAFEIVKRYTPYTKPNVELHKLDKLAGHPQDLGDYDVLAFYPEKNSVLSIECKDIVHPHCLKDAKTLRETIFGEAGKDHGHFKQINKRTTYLTTHLAEVAKSMGWPITTQPTPKIVSIYLTRTAYWWTRFPPMPVDTVFVRIDMLSTFIDQL